MKTIHILLVMSFFFTTQLNAQMIQNSEDSLAYSLGVLVAGNLKSGGYGDVKMDAFLAGFMASMKGEPTLMTQEQCQQHVSVDAPVRKEKMNEKVKKAGEKFLAENKSKPGVTTLESGLQYLVLKMGDGAKPKATDKVNVHYHGTLIDGTVFDSSVERGESISFPLNQVIKGWTEVVQLMPVGSKWRVFIPYNLAYGDRAAGPSIPPYSTLIFEIELLAIE